MKYIEIIYFVAFFLQEKYVKIILIIMYKIGKENQNNEEDQFKGICNFNIYYGFIDGVFGNKP